MAPGTNSILVSVPMQPRAEAQPSWPQLWGAAREQRGAEKSLLGRLGRAAGTRAEVTVPSSGGR